MVAAVPSACPLLLGLRERKCLGTLVPSFEGNPVSEWMWKRGLSVGETRLGVVGRGERGLE